MMSMCTLHVLSAEQRRQIAMQKRSIIWLTLTLSLLLMLVVACGPTTTTHNPSTNAGHSVASVPVAENIYVLDGYTPLSGNTIGGQQIVAFRTGSANPSTLVTLPVGLTSQDHQRLYTATAKNGQTTIAIINTSTGKTMHSFVIAGTYTIAEQDFVNSVSSPDGRWLALRQTMQTGKKTTIALVDTEAEKLVRTISLDGNFSLDAISPQGGMLYLLQYLPDGSGHYYVKAYDTRANQLLPIIIADKSELNDPRMVGTALTRQISANGEFAYTLYIDTWRNIAFVHILPLADKSEPGGPNQLPVPAFARCLDLPVGKSADLLRYYTLALSPDGNTLYAANGALGTITAISLSNDEYSVFSNDISSQVKFNPGHISMTSSDTTRMLHNGAVLSPDGATLYFTGVHGIWAADTINLGVKGNYLAQQAFTGVGMSADGHTLYAVDPAQGITLLDPATWQTQQIIQSPLHAPWGIEWVAG
jgi:DNA-binding beta-propeller fold protein YncE